MGAGGASGGNGGSYGSAQKGRKASTPGTQVGFSEATKGTGSDPKEKTDTKEKSLGEKVGGDGGGAIGTSGQVVQAPQPVTSPTTAEVSQVSATEAEEPIILRKRRTLARGRSQTIFTGPTGVSGGLTLGKPSLLGR
jgi:hypothetical protein